MSYKKIAPGILVKFKKGQGNFGNHDHPEDRFYILTELETEDGHCDEDMLVFYGLFEERFFSSYRWYIERYIDNGAADIVA